MAHADALRSILEHAETVGLPDGTYVRVANALRDVFNNRGEARQNVRHILGGLYESNLKVSFNKGGLEYYVRLLRQERTCPTGGGMSVYKTTYKFARDDTTYEGQRSFRSVVDDFLKLHRPKEVIIHYGSARVHIRESMVRRQMKIEYTLLDTRLKESDVSDRQREQYEDMLDEMLVYTYSDFVCRVLARLPDNENMEFY